jgi:hypothetical protein
MHILIATPTYRLEPEMLEAALAMERGAHRVDWLFSFGNKQASPEDRGKAAILENYRRMRGVLLSGPYDALLTLESDVIAPPETLIHLAALIEQHGADVAYGGYYFRHGTNVHINLLRHVQSSNPDAPLTLRPDQWYAAYDAQGPIQVSGSALGCTLIARTVLDKIDFRESGVHCDTPFTADVWRAGYSMMADTRVLCGHKRPDGVIMWPQRQPSPRMTLGTPGLRGGLLGNIDGDPVGGQS